MARFLWKPGTKAPKHNRLVAVAFTYPEEGTYPVPLGEYYVKFANFVDGKWVGTADMIPYVWSDVPAISPPTL